MMHSITISTIHGDRLVAAYRHGKFAVNRVAPDSPINPVEAIWSITHVATGLQVTRIRGRAKARKYARMLDAAIETDITPEDHANKTPAWNTFVKALATID